MSSPSGVWGGAPAEISHYLATPLCPGRGAFVRVAWWRQTRDVASELRVWPHGVDSVSTHLPVCCTRAGWPRSNWACLNATRCQWQWLWQQQLISRRYTDHPGGSMDALQNTTTTTTTTQQVDVITKYWNSVDLPSIKVCAGHTEPPVDSVLDTTLLEWWSEHAVRLYHSRQCGIVLNTSLRWHRLHLRLLYDARLLMKDEKKLPAKYGLSSLHFGSVFIALFNQPQWISPMHRKGRQNRCNESNYKAF